MKNVGGVNFTNLTATLQTSDPYITITDNSGSFGALLVDSTKENIPDPFELTASASTPMGHAAVFTLIVQEGAFADTFTINHVIGTYDYLIWNPDLTPGPGQAADDILTALGYNGVYATTMPLTDLAQYRAVLVFLGIFPNNEVIEAASPEAAALVNHINSGGRMYMEGGDCWYYDPLVGGYNFCPIFGIYASADGSTDLGPISGQTGTFTNQMNFTYTGENSYMDHIDPTGTGYLIFMDTDNAYNCGIANDAGTYRTVGTSFELGNLTDGSGVSTRAALLDSIMHFFGVHVTAVKEDAGTQAIGLRFSLRALPNISHGTVQITYSVKHPAGTELKVYDAAGRVVNDLSRNLSSAAVSGMITWPGKDQSGRPVSAGIYFIRLSSGGLQQTAKVILTQ
ncbi:MAG TPA: T9SS type A sorting domain-containing protein [bacterium]